MAPYSRAEFEQRRAAVRRVELREGLILSVTSVALGFAQIAFLRWADLHLTRSRRLAIAGPAFLVYLAVVGFLLWRYLRKRSRAAPTCPACGRGLGDTSQRIAVATGRCDACGGQVIA